MCSYLSYVYTDYNTNFTKKPVFSSIFITSNFFKKKCIVILGVMDKLVSIFRTISSSGQNGGCF